LWGAPTRKQVGAIIKDNLTAHFVGNKNLTAHFLKKEKLDGALLRGKT